MLSAVTASATVAASAEAFKLLVSAGVVLTSSDFVVSFITSDSPRPDGPEDLPQSQDILAFNKKSFSARILVIGGSTENFAAVVACVRIVDYV